MILMNHQRKPKTKTRKDISGRYGAIFEKLNQYSGQIFNNYNKLKKMIKYQ